MVRAKLILAGRREWIHGPAFNESFQGVANGIHAT